MRSLLAPLAALLVASCAPDAPCHDDGTGRCVETGCAVGFHDGGTGACLPASICSPGFHDGGAGACVAAKACSESFHDDGAGACVSSGCATGYHDGGVGACVAEGTCALGFHDGGDATCVPLDLCVDGFRDTGPGTCMPAGTPCETGYLDLNGHCVAWSLLGGPGLIPYDDHAAVRLADGRVLVTGGAWVMNATSISAEARLFDPSTASFTRAAPMHAPRTRHAAILLPDGRVLVAGGVGSGTTPLSTTELYDPATDSWSAGPSAVSTSGAYGQGGASATLLADGRVLLAGGCDASRASPTTHALLLDVTRPRATEAAAMPVARCEQGAATLADGRVLVCGGRTVAQSDGARCDVYDPATGRWAAAPRMLYPRPSTALARLGDGRVLAVGSVGAATWDPGSSAWTMAGGDFLPGAVRATLLPSGRVLVTRGSASGLAPSAQVFEPDTGAWIPASPMPSYFGAHSATALGDGTVLVLGRGYGLRYVGGL